MFDSINTAKNRLTTIMVLAFGYLLSPLLFGIYLYYSFHQSYYPPNADVVAIPFAGFFLLWVISFPVFIVLCFSIELLGRRLDTISRQEITGLFLEQNKSVN